MRLALVSYIRRDEGQIPIGLLTLTQIAREEGIHDIRVLDLPDRRHEPEFIESLREHDVVGFSSICSTYNETIRLCKRLKAVSPQTEIVLGGPQASLTAVDSLSAFPFVDAVFLGEAEHSWRAFLDHRRAQTGSLATVPGIVWRHDNEIRKNEPAPLVHDLATLPVPAFELYEFPGGTTITPIEIGRGCPFACSFCSTSPFFKRKFRLKPVNRILDEMDRLHELFGSRRFYFVQDSFSSRRTFVEAICTALRDHHRSYTWYCSARTDQVSDDLVSRMKQAGCRGIYFGLETGSQRMQQVINKKLDVERALEVIRRTADQGLDVTTSMIIGFPQETVADLRESLRVFLDLKARGHALVQLHILAPLPGSALINEGHALRYDPMPSDFSDTSHVLDAEDRGLVQSHPQIFANFWHFINPEVSRQRLLFLAHFLGLASLYFPNTLRLAAKYTPESLLDRLLDGPTPEPYYADPTFPSELPRWIDLTHEVLENFSSGLSVGPGLSWALQYDYAYSRTEVEASSPLTLLWLPSGVGEQPGRHIVDGLEAGGSPAPFVIQKPDRAVQVLRISDEAIRALRISERVSAGRPIATSKSTQLLPSIADDMARLIQATCAACGECCFEPGGILCGQDEWPAIRSALAARLGKEPKATPLNGSNLLSIKEQQVIPADPCGGERTRRACPALIHDEGGWRCSIEGLKPAGCIAYPMKLILQPGRGDHEPPVIGLALEAEGGPTPCPLEAALTGSPGLMARYAETLKARLAHREGAFSLALYNTSQRRGSQSFLPGKPG